jgi:hypothetical protein
MAVLVTRRSFPVLVALALAAGTAGPARADIVLGFDNLTDTASGLPVPQQYGGANFSWSNFYYINSAEFNANNGSPSGFGFGTVSAPAVAYNFNGTAATLSSTSPFNLISGYFTGAWNDNLMLNVQATTGGYNVNQALSATAPTLVTFNFFGVTSVTFMSSGGTKHAGFNGNGTQFVMDNLDLSLLGSSIPEPSPLALGALAAALAGAGRAAVLRARRAGVVSPGNSLS